MVFRHCEQVLPEPSLRGAKSLVAWIENCCKFGYVIPAQAEIQHKAR
ncbi:hypothetical protein RFEPED_1053 [Rickettsia felis str. Pedreira]|uniref:Uncharacterized protein n=1 Tax=Rickettsia felis str. Pedreira TaxID=1359196 RepID=A0A0F3MTB2_RICFI|nr:hypothetical protein [Rickettsia felis]KJV58662.1 hypothetical protein RFEPED_1053 [Rickettsia felis str. Pedreira]